MIRRILLALGAGMVGSLGNVLSVWLINAAFGTFSFDKQFVYKQVFWGALWALPYCFDFFRQHWVAKGVAVSSVASFFTFFVFQSLPLTPEFMLRAFIVNVLFWGCISSWLYHVGAGGKNKPR